MGMGAHFESHNVSIYLKILNTSIKLDEKTLKHFITK